MMPLEGPIRNVGGVCADLFFLFFSFFLVCFPHWLSSELRSIFDSHCAQVTLGISPEKEWKLDKKKKKKMFFCLQPIHLPSTVSATSLYLTDFRHNGISDYQPA